MTSRPNFTAPVEFAAVAMTFDAAAALSLPNSNLLWLSKDGAYVVAKVRRPWAVKRNLVVTELGRLPLAWGGEVSAECARQASAADMAIVRRARGFASRGPRSGDGVIAAYGA
ncbi:hypothetical protein [Bradyrhizobium manausense]|uniref:Uncharacterized protein n=1 Tax=Bradyrhizobium manausense TaxID=989370 RepID=A0A0R3D4R2_9BRAD|nr:hypothetical protein [Bradyrhizobium manausense]KRQ03262.1 hypothetical protein AOQ71_31535 [Bradyrhizobium manausense]